MVADFKNKIFHQRSSESKECKKTTIPIDIDLKRIIRNFMSPKTGWSTYLGEVERGWADEKYHAVFSYHEFEFWTVENVLYFTTDDAPELQYIEVLNKQLIFEVTKNDERKFKDEDFKEYLCGGKAEEWNEEDDIEWYPSNDEEEDRE